jgi:hypothetical protein
LDRAPLEASLRRADVRGSYYWAFLGRRGKARRRDHTVEVRLDLPSKELTDFAIPVGWKLARLDCSNGMVFLRRVQPLRDEDLRALFAEALTFAFERDGRFHSWMHDPLADWSDDGGSSASS